MIVLCWIGILLLSGMAFSDVKTYNIGETAILNCIIGSHNATLDWIQYPVGSSHLPQHIYNTRFGFEPAYKSGGRHEILQYAALGSRDLSIANLNFNDSGLYVCNSRGSAYSTTELTVTDSNSKCGSNVSLNNVLVENDCDLDPDIIQASCSVGYRGNQPPMFNWYHSGDGEIIKSARIHNTTDGKTAVSSLIVKASMQLNQTFFSCEVNTSDQQTRVKCSLPEIDVSYVFKESQIRITEGQHDSYECMANTSQLCAYEWRGKHSNPPYNLINAHGQTIQLQNIEILRCIANCSIRNSSCLSVSSTFAGQSVGISSSSMFYAIVLPVLSVVIIFIIISIIIVIYKKRRTIPVEKRESVSLLQDHTETHSKTKQQLGKRERSKNGTDLGNDPTSKKSKPSEPRVSDVKQSTSTSTNDPPVQDPVSEHRPCTSQQRSVRCDAGNSLSSVADNAIQHDNQQSGLMQKPCSEDQDDDEINLDEPTSTDIAKYNKGFEKVRTKLDGYIDPLNRLPFCFVDNEIMTYEEAEKIELSKPETIQIVAKMNECLKKDPKNCLPILKALIENDQIHIAKFIVSSGKNTLSSDRVLQQVEKEAIDGNMFCLEKLVRPRVNDFLALLVELKCITANHKNWIIVWEKEKKDVYQLFEILKRRSYRHFTDFLSCLQGTGQTLIVDVLGKGGVVEITNHLKGIEHRTDRETIEKGIIAQLCGYVDSKDGNKLNEDQKVFIHKLFNLLNQKENKIKFIGCYTTKSISMYFQCATDFSQKWLVDFCGNGGLRKELNSLFRLLQPDLNSYCNFDIDVSVTNSSKIHSIDTTIRYDSVHPAYEILENPPNDAACNSTLILDGGRSFDQTTQEKESSKVEKLQIQSPATNDLAKKQILDCYTTIKQYLDPRYGVLDQLYEKGVLNHGMFISFSSSGNPEECCQKLLNHLLKEVDINKSLAVFKEILQKDHSWIYNMIWLNPEDVINKNDRPLSKDERRRIIFNIRCLIKLIDPYKGDFLSHLVEKDCITLSQFQTLIEMGKVDKSDMISELFTILLRRSFVHFQLFIQCLNLTLQHNLVRILESNGIVLDMKINLQNSKFERHTADLLTGTTELDALKLDREEEKLIKRILQSLEDKGLVIVDCEAVNGSLIIYILLSSVNAVNEMEMLHDTKEIETTLKIVTEWDVTIMINHDEFSRCRKFFSEHHNCLTPFKSSDDHRVHHCGMLNEMPFELFEMILKQTSWMMWVCNLISSLQSCPVMPMKEYLKMGMQGFYNSVTDIFLELSSVCSIWLFLVKHKKYGKSIKSTLFLKISKITLERSKKILIENLDLQDGSLELFLRAKLITDKDKTDCKSMTEKKSNEIFLGFLYRDKKHIFYKLRKFLFLLEEQCKGHLVNHVISLGVYRLNFERRWPLDKKTKLRISAFSEADSENNTLLEQGPTSGRNLLSLLLEHKCITPEKEKLLNQTRDSEKIWQKIMKLLENGSIEMFEIAIDYFKETGQHGVVDLLRPNQELLKYGEHIVNCLNSSSEILDRMVDNSKIASSIKDHFLTEDHHSYFDQLNRFQKNETVLKILECSPPAVYSYFLNSLLATKQPLFPMFKRICHSKLIESYESYLIDSIGIDKELLENFIKFKVISNSQRRAIESESLFFERCKKLWKIVSQSSPKSFNLALAALVESGRPNILENMQITWTDSYELCNQDTSVADKPVTVETPSDAEQMFSVEEYKTNERRSHIEFQDSDKVSQTISVKVISPHEELTYGDEASQPPRYEKSVEVKAKMSSGSALNKFTPLSSAKSFIIRNKASLPDDIQNLLLLKVVAIEQLPSVGVHSLSRDLSSLLKYVSNNSSNILKRKIILPPDTLPANFSIIIKSEEVINRKKIKEEFTMKLIVKHFHEELTTNIDPSKFILQMLVKNNVLTQHQMTEVESMPNSELRSEKLLWILSVAEHTTACSDFVETLKQEYPKLFHMMDVTSFRAYRGKVQPKKELEALNDREVQSETDNEESHIPLNEHGIGSRIQGGRVEYDLSNNNGEAVEYGDVETSKSHSTNNESYKILRKRGESFIKFKLFDVPENTQVFMVRVQLMHGRAESSGSVNFLVNDDMVIRGYDSAPYGMVGAQQFLIPSICLKDGTNWFTIVFDTSNSGGQYCLSDIAVDYSYIQVRDGKLNNTTISKDFKFDFSGEVTGAQFTNVLNQDYYRKIKPYKFFNDRGNSRVVIKFNIEEDDSTSLCWLVVLLHHCRTTGEGSVNLYVNNVLLHSNLYPIPRDKFIDEKFIIQRELLFVGKNTLTIELSKNSHGVYWLSDVVIKVVCFKPPIEPL